MHMMPSVQLEGRGNRRRSRLLEHPSRSASWEYLLARETELDVDWLSLCWVIRRAEELNLTVLIRRNLDWESLAPVLPPLVDTIYEYAKATMLIPR